MNFPVIPTKDHQSYVRLAHSTIIIPDSIRLYNKLEFKRESIPEMAQVVISHANRMSAELGYSGSSFGLL